MVMLRPSNSPGVSRSISLRWTRTPNDSMNALKSSKKSPAAGSILPGIARPDPRDRMRQKELLMSLRLNACLAAALGSALLVSACGGGSSTPAPSGSSTSGPATAGGANVSVDKNSYPVFPDADAGADPAVPAEQGGKGFKGEGWQTNTSFDLIGDPRALKGGVLRDAMLSFPGTLRMAG